MDSLDRSGYGLRDGALWFIADVPSGLACRCVCAACGAALVAKKGPIRQPHFAHYVDAGCGGAGESALHRLAKELLAELPTFEVPPYLFIRERSTKWGGTARVETLVAKGGPVAVKRVGIEQRDGDVIPDIVIEAASKRLLVEVAVTHRVDRVKLRKLRRRDLPTLEIRLDPADCFLPRSDLREKLRSNSPAKTWLFHPGQRPAEREFAAKFRRAAAESRRKPLFAAKISSRRRKRDGEPGWMDYNRLGEQFKRRYGHYPSIKELRKRWPNLFPEPPAPPSQVSEIPPALTGSDTDPKEPLP